MNKRSSKRQVDGWLIINKPAGITSTGVVNKAKWLLNAKKAGHAGTLDPDATGLLAVAFGEATKTIPYITDALKAYEFVVTLGTATNTDDADGHVIDSSDIRPSDDDIRMALPKFMGDIQQVPPQFSAVKVAGERAYTVARRGDSMELASRPLFVQELKLLERLSKDDVKLLLQCGKGGYVRSIARDLGQNMGCLAHVKWLHRISSGPFDLQQSISIDALENQSDRDQFLLPLEAGLSEIAGIEIGLDDVAKIQNGMEIQVDIDPVGPDTPVWVHEQGRAHAIGIIKDGAFHPKRVILEHGV